MTSKEDLLGSKVLVGLTYLDAAGGIIKQVQFSGIVKAINERIEIEEEDGNISLLPPDTSAFHPATPGEYRLKQTGKVIKNPDYLCTYDITAPYDH